MIAGDDRPLAPFGRREAVVGAVEQIGPYSIVTALDADGPRPRAGQFYMLQTVEGWSGGEDGRPYLPRALSFARATPYGGGLNLEFLLEAVGPGTGRLASCAPGERLLIAGPFGNGFVHVDGPKLLVAGGIGLAPVVALSEELGDAPHDVFVGMRSAAYAESVSHYLGESAEVATEDGSRGATGYVTALFEPLAGSTIYACGPPAMLEAVRVLAAASDTGCQLAMESGMACGYGACFGCVVPTSEGGYVRLCVDGPVLEGSDLESALIPGTGHVPAVV